MDVMSFPSPLSPPVPPCQGAQLRLGSCTVEAGHADPGDPSMILERLTAAHAGTGGQGLQSHIHLA